MPVSPRLPVNGRWQQLRAMLDLLHLDRLKEGRVLLAFSGGVDSSALFHLLRENSIDFDIAHVNYHTRASSDAEALSAEALAATHSLTCHTHSCRLEGVNFEHRAREERYRFFGYLIQKYGYRYLLTAHQLNDRLEWLMMQLCRGSGLPELLGIRSIDRRDEITIIRPLLEENRESIEAYLRARNLPSFNDESNSDERYTRNFFRHRFSSPLMRQYQDGIKRSFRYLEEDTDQLIEPLRIERCEAMFYFQRPATLASLIRHSDTALKKVGHVMKGAEKELLKGETALVVGRIYLIWVSEDFVFIAPYQEASMEKGFKEECRKLGIEPKMRGYLATHPRSFETMRRLRGAPAPLLSD